MITQLFTISTHYLHRVTIASIANAATAITATAPNCLSFFGSSFFIISSMTFRILIKQLCRNTAAHIGYFCTAKLKNPAQTPKKKKLTFLHKIKSVPKPRDFGTD